MVNGLAFRLMGRDDDVDDLVQDSFLAAYRTLDRLAAPQAFASWLAGIVARTAYKRLRRRRLLSRLGLRRSLPIDIEAVLAPAASPEARAELTFLYRAIDALPPMVRLALLLHRVEGLSVSEVAERLGVSAATVKRRLKEARERLAVLDDGVPSSYLDPDTSAEASR